jgi:hypothetical protein
MLTVIESLEELRRGTEPIIYFSRYRADQVDNGGARRSAQLRQLLAGYDVAVVSSLTKQPAAAEGNSARSGNAFFDRAVQLLVRCRTRKFREEFGRWLFFSDRLAKRWVKALQLRQKPRLLLVDDPIFFPSLIRYCTDQKIPVIAHCHNIETLSRGQVMPHCQQELLAYELGLLAQCRAAVTISSEEAFLLCNLGMTAEFLPYYPPAAIEEQLLMVRMQRAESDKRDFILMGSAGNAPTREGMVQLLGAWRSMGGLSGERLHVVGYGTEMLRDAGGIAGVEFRGAVTDQELAELLIRVRGGIVYQESGAGALTRIGEYLLAGVPVLANSHAARSYHNNTGIVEFACLHELRSTLVIFLSTKSEVPLLNQTAPAFLWRLIDAVLNGN